MPLKLTDTSKNYRFRDYQNYISHAYFKTLLIVTTKIGSWKPIIYQNSGRWMSAKSKEHMHRICTST